MHLKSKWGCFYKQVGSRNRCNTLFYRFATGTIKLVTNGLHLNKFINYEETQQIHFTSILLTDWIFFLRNFENQLSVLRTLIFNSLKSLRRVRCRIFTKHSFDCPKFNKSANGLSTRMSCISRKGQRVTVLKVENQERGYNWITNFYE